MIEARGPLVLGLLALAGLVASHSVAAAAETRRPPGLPWHRFQAAHGESELATDVVTLPELLKGRGYATAFLGMWNLGRGRTGPVTPGGQGFDTGDTYTLGASVNPRKLSAASLAPGHSPCDLARGPWHSAPPPKPGLVEAAVVTYTPW